ncbi:MAG: caspase family protein [Bacteroidales bacterium]
MKTTYKLFRNSVVIVILLFTFPTIRSQALKSEKSALWVSTKTEDSTPVLPDKTPPTLTFSSHKIEDGRYIHKDEASISLIGQVTDESGLSYIALNSELIQTTEAGVFVKNLQLTEGENELSIVAVDNKNNLLRSNIIIEYAPSIMTLADKIETESNYYGLIIGIDNYLDPAINNLDNPVRDAQSIRDVLVNNYTFKEENITFLQDATYEQIVISFDELSKKVKPTDNLLVFYAGHGWWDKDANNGYWLPSDASKSNKSFWFRNSTLVDYLKEVQSKHTLLITDACFGGAIFKTRSAFNVAPRAIEMLYDMQSRKAMTSGTLTEVPDQSAFTKYLVERLSENQDKYLSSEQLFSSFRIAVINNSDAVPQYGEIRNVGDQGGDFVFIKK